MSLGWLAYLPIPGLALVPAFVQKHDRNARFHAWQGGALVILAWLALILVGALERISGGAVMSAIIGTITLFILLAYITAALVGGIASSRDRYVRIRPVYDLLAVIKRR